LVHRVSVTRERRPCGAVRAMTCDRLPMSEPNAPKNRGGRPRTTDPRAVRVVVKLTGDEALEASRLAALDGVTVSDVLRRGVRGAPRSQAPSISRRA